MTAAASGQEPAACLLCGARDVEDWARAVDVEYLSTPEVFHYARCPACRVLSISPVPQDALDVIYPPNYYAYASQRPGPVERAKAWLDVRLFRRLLHPLPAASLSVLDVGGGDGAQLDEVRRADPRVQRTKVVDMDPRATELARRAGHEVFCGRIEDFRDERRFDLVLLLNLIEHVADPEAVLRRIRELLAPDGLVLVKTPNIDSLDARLFRHRNWGGYHCPRHWVLFDREGFTRLARRAGLGVRSFRYTQGGPFWSTSLLHPLARRGWIRVSRERPLLDHPLFPLLAAGFAVFDELRIRLGGRPSQMFFVLARE